MRKVYLTPAIEVSETQVCHMLAESLPISNQVTVDGSQALSKEDESWDIWDE